MNGIVIAIITFWIPVPKIETTARANIISGNDIKTSITRWKTRSNFPPKYALLTPRISPMTDPTNAETKPTNNAVRAPYTILEKISLPN